MNIQIKINGENHPISMIDFAAGIIRPADSCEIIAIKDAILVVQLPPLVLAPDKPMELGTDDAIDLNTQDLWNKEPGEPTSNL